MKVIVMSDLSQTWPLAWTIMTIPAPIGGDIAPDPTPALVLSPGLVPVHALAALTMVAKTDVGLMIGVIGAVDRRSPHALSTSETCHWIWTKVASLSFLLPSLGSLRLGWGRIASMAGIKDMPS